MNAVTQVRELFERSIELKRKSAPVLAPKIARAAGLIIDSLEAEGTVFSCGNGGSAADAQHFSSEMLNRFELPRRGLAATALSTDSSTLTSIANDYDYREVFSRQVEVLGRGGDILLAITTSGSSPNIVLAIRVAHQRGMHVVLLAGRDGGTALAELNADDVDITVPGDSTARIQEVHLLCIHCLCHLIDQHFAETDTQA